MKNKRSKRTKRSKFDIKRALSEMHEHGEKRSGTQKACVRVQKHSNEKGKETRKTTEVRSAQNTDPILLYLFQLPFPLFSAIHPQKKGPLSPKITALAQSHVWWSLLRGLFELAPVWNTDIADAGWIQLAQEQVVRQQTENDILKVWDCLICCYHQLLELLEHHFLVVKKSFWMV